MDLFFSCKPIWFSSKKCEFSKPIIFLLAAVGAVSNHAYKEMSATNLAAALTIPLR